MQAPVAQVERLDELEAAIARGLDTFVEVGAALTEIREQRLYRFRDGYTTFEQYCQERWGFSRIHAHHLIDAAEVATVLTNVNSPKSEAVARELVPLKGDPTKLRAAWSQATARTLTPTAREVRAVVSELVTKNKERAERKSALRVFQRDDSEVLTQSVVAAAVAEADADRAFEAVSDACATLSELISPADFIARLPRSISEYPTNHFRVAHEWLGDFLKAVR